MFKTLVLSTAVAASALTAFPAAAQAQGRYGYNNDYGYAYRDDGRRYDNRRYDGRRYDNRRYNDRAYYGGRYNYDRRYGNYYGRRCSGETGTIIGAIAGGLLGSQVAGRGDRTVGALIGGAAGALAGNAIDRNDCRR